MRIRNLFIVLLVFISLCNFNKAFSQGTLSVQSMPGFPDLPLDSAYEGQTYFFDIILVNNTNTFINSTISFNLRVDSNISVFFSNPQTAIGPNDTIQISVPGYDFTQPQFKIGNNIVVVWPVVNGMSIPIDSSYYNVHFIPLNSTGGVDLTEPSFRIFPVPAKNLLFFESKGNVVEDVRIWNVNGQLISLSSAGKNNAIDITPLAPGIYVIDLLIDGNRVMRKFIRE